MNELKQFNAIDFDMKYENNLTCDVILLINHLNNNCYRNEQFNFVEFCIATHKLKTLFHEKRIKDRTGQFYGFNEIMQGFGLDKTQTSRLLCSYDKYIINDKLKPQFFGFTKCKLFELLPVDLKILEYDIKHKFLRPDHTVQTIRKYVRTKLPHEIENPEIEIDEDTIPMAHDVTKWYNFDYYKSKTQLQLVNIVWDMQKRYVKQK